MGIGLHPSLAVISMASLFSILGGGDSLFLGGKLYYHGEGGFIGGGGGGGGGGGLPLHLPWILVPGNHNNYVHAPCTISIA